MDASNFFGRSTNLRQIFKNESVSTWVLMIFMENISAFWEEKKLNILATPKILTICYDSSFSLAVAHEDIKIGKQYRCIYTTNI
jgi:hypothetical protein